MSKRVLVVDDLSVNRRILGGMLKGEYDVYEAPSGEVALEKLENNKYGISAILLDIFMTGIDGFEVLKRIRSNPIIAGVPVIMITSSTDEATRIKALALGANDFIMVPYNSSVIRHCLKNNIALMEAKNQLNAMRRDDLTGLYTREAFFDKVREMIMAHESGYYIMACFDVNKFKVVNDQYGTAKGDRVLRHIADTFLNGFDPLGGICCRIAADHFAVLYPAGAADTDEIAEIRERASNIEGLVSPIVFSIGRYVINDLTMSPSAMYDRAMLAADSIKGKYGEEIVYYDESMREKLIHEQEIVSEMVSALTSHQFEVWFQPQYNHSTDAMIGAEALVRWRHPQKGLISPAMFIPVFEQNGFIYELDKYVWDDVCRSLRKWLDEGRMPLPISVNISRYDALQPDVVEVIDDTVKSYNLPVNLLRLEITESAFSETPERIVQIVSELIDKGFTVEIDDFGSGYSSLNTLKDVPAQIIKLDMKFLERGNPERGGNIVESVIRMAKWLGMSVIAEGVETLQQADYLRSVGCSYIQGFLYAKPMPKKIYEEFCRGSYKEEKLITLETIENLNNNSFWNPASMDTLIFNSYVGGACIYEYKDGKIELLRASEKYAQVIGSAGMTVEDALKLSWEKHLDRENSERLMGDLQKSILGKREVVGEYVFTDLPNCPHKTYLRTTMRVIASAGDRYLVYCTNENMTAQREAEIKKDAATKQLQAILENINGGVTASINVDGRVKYVYANETFYKMLGYTREEYDSLFTGALGTVHEEDREHVTSVSTLASREKTSYSIEFRIVKKSGEVRWVISNVTMMDFPDYDEPVQLAVMSDITEQKELLDNVPYGAALYEYDNGALTVVHLNKRYWELVGRSEKALNSHEFMNAVHFDDRQSILSELELAIREKRDFASDVSILCGTNEYKRFHINGRIVPKGENRYSIYAAYSVLTDEEMAIRETLPIALKTMMETQTGLSFVKDRNLRYVCASKSIYEAVGAESADAIAGKTDFDLMEESLAREYAISDMSVIESGESVIEKITKLPDAYGQNRYSSTSKFPLKDSKGNIIGLYAIGQDITEAREMKNQLELLTNNIPGGIAVYSGSPEEPEKIRITYFSDGFHKLFGYSREEYESLTSDNPLGLAYPEDLPALSEGMNELAYENKPLDCVFRARKKDGAIIWVNLKAVIGEVRGGETTVNAVLFDVTDRQEALENLRMREEENYIAMAQSENTICRYSVKDKTITISDKVPEIFDAKKVSENIPYSEIEAGKISPETQDVYIAFYAAIERGEKTGTMVYQRKSLAGMRWINEKFTTIFSNDGKPVSAVISFNDVTDEMEKETVYRKWQQSLNDKDKSGFTLFRCNLSKDASYDTREGTLISFDFESAGLNFMDRAMEYARHVVHEDDRERYLKFINSDTMLASYYRGRRSDTIEYREMTGIGERWLRLSVDLVEYPNSTDVEAYLMYENIDEIKVTELKTKSLAENDQLTGLLNRGTFESKVRAILKSEHGDRKYAIIMMDADGFKQVNDVFGHGVGDKALIDIAAALRGTCRKSDLIARLGGDEYMVFMNGISDAEAAESLAKRIRAAARKSFSLEVSISLSVGISMMPDNGTTFEELYKKADAALYHVKGSGKDGFAFYSDNMVREHLTPQTEDDAGNKRRLLVVDDSAIDHAFMKNIFKDEFIVETANSGNEALIRLRHYGAAISAVLLDLMMPGMDGFDVLRKMRQSQELRNIPVIIVSGDDSRETCLRTIREGANDFITKPIDPELLKIRLRAAITNFENERLRAQNNLLQIQKDERIRYEAALEGSGIAVSEYDCDAQEFTYYPSMTKYVCGVFDKRPLWDILFDNTLSEKVRLSAKKLIDDMAKDESLTDERETFTLKTPADDTHRFRVHVKRLTDEYRPLNKLLITLIDMNYFAS